jgi:epoxyqueuosine reductase
MERRERIRELALDAGFDLAGFAPLRPPQDAARFRSWLANGFHAGLDYLERHAERIADPRSLSPVPGTLLIVGLAHSRPGIELPGGGRIARYAAGRDYHNVLTKRLRSLRARLVAEGIIGRENLARPIVDAGPLLERSHAAEAGLGFLSKAANLLHPAFGPWFFLGELVLGLELEPSGSPPAGSCGTCTACLDVCPTQAIREPGLVDARACLSYHTIENRGAIPRELRARLGEWAFGCDLCSEVCPWGAKSPDESARFGTHRFVEEHGLERWIGLRDPSEWSETLRGSGLQRARRDGLARNAAIVLGNVPRPSAEPVLLDALSFDPSAIVREAAGWALAHGYARRDVVERAAASERDESVRSELRRTLETEP